MYKKKNLITNHYSFYAPCGQGSFSNYDLSDMKAIGVFRLVMIVDDHFVMDDRFTCFPFEDWEEHFIEVDETEQDNMLKMIRSQKCQK